MGNIGEISIRDISKKYNLGFRYAQNVVNKLEEIGYIKKISDYKYAIIHTETDIDNYICMHLSELRPMEYDENGVKDDGNLTLKSRISFNIAYCKIILPKFIKRILFSIPLCVFMFLLLLFYLSIDFGIDEMSLLERIAFYLWLILNTYIFIGIPFNIFVRIMQSKVYKMRFKDFMLLPKNWFFKRCQDTIDLYILLYSNKVKFKIGNYDRLTAQLKDVLVQKKALAEHYADIANNAENENEFYQSINSCINTLEWMSQFEKFGVFSEDTAPSKDIQQIKDGMPISIERFRKRMSGELDTPNLNYDFMEGHDFEYFCADVLRKNGFVNVGVTQGSGDHGIDVLAEKDGITYAIQCKCYTSNIGNAAVQQAHTGKSLYHKDIAVVMTNRYFTQQAIEEANLLGVKLWDRDKLNEMIQD